MERKNETRIIYQLCFWSDLTEEWVVMIECKTEEEAKNHYIEYLHYNPCIKLAIFEKEEIVKYRKLDYLDCLSDKWKENLKKEIKQCFDDCKKQYDGWKTELNKGFYLEIFVDTTPGKEEEYSYFIRLGHDEASKVADQYEAYCSMESYEELERTVFAYLKCNSRLIN